jgi:hypothetical protein
MRNYACCPANRCGSCRAPRSYGSLSWGFAFQQDREKKQFFFEKKNQKTFIHEVGGWGSTRQNVQKFFASFFQKRRSFFYGSISN